MLDDLERIRTFVRDRLGAAIVVTTSPVPLHATFTALDVRVANVKSKTACAPPCPSSWSVTRTSTTSTPTRSSSPPSASDYYHDDDRHVHRHAVRYIVSEFLRLFADPALHLQDVDTSWQTPIEKTAPIPSKEPRPPKASKPKPPLWRRAARRVKRTIRPAR